MTEAILYIKKGNRSSIIYSINNEKQEILLSPEKYLNSCCLKDLTTLEGRLEALKILFDIKKNIPIYINENLVLFTTTNKKSYKNIFINSMFINKIIKKDEKVEICFFDNQKILIEADYHRIKLSYEKCLKINNLIKNLKNKYC